MGVNQLEILNYEVRSSWWAPWISWAPLQEISGRYFAWKVRRKYRRYLYRIKSEQEVNSCKK